MDMDLSDDIYNYNLGMTVERDLYLTGDESISFRAYFKNCSITQLCDISILTKEQLLVLLKFSNMLMCQIMPVKCILLTLKTIRSNLNIDLVEICYPDKDNNNLVIHYMLKDGVLHKKEINLINNGIFHTVFNTGDIIKIDNCHNDQRFIPIYDQHTDIIINNILLCPLFDSNHIVWGIAAVSNITSNDYQLIDNHQYIYSPKPGYHIISHLNSYTSPEVTSTSGPTTSLPPEVTITVPTAVEASPPEVGLADSSSDYLSLKGNATPGDRGEESETIHGSRGEVNKEAVCKTISSGMKSSTGPRVEPGSDLRELEGEVNREAVCKTTSDAIASGRRVGLDLGGAGIKACELASNEDLNSSTEAGTVNNSSFESIQHSTNTCTTNTHVKSTVGRPADNTPPEVQSLSSTVPTAVEASPNYLSLKGIATPRDRGGSEGVKNVTSSGEPAADLREAEGKVIRRADGRTTSGGDGRNVTSGGTSSSGIADKYLLECYGNSEFNTPDSIKNKLNTLYNIEKSINPIQYPSSYNQKHITTTRSNKPNENHTSSHTHSDNSPLDVQSTSVPLGIPPEVGLADSSSDYLSLKGNATPGDRGEESETINGSRGEVNRRGTTPSGKTSSGLAVCKTTSGGTASGKTTSSGEVPCTGGEGVLEKSLDGMDILSSMGSLKIVDVGMMDENMNTLSNDLVSCDKSIWDLNTITFILQICEMGGRCISTAIHQRELNATKERANGLLTLMHSLFSDRLGIQSCVVALTTHAKKLLQAERCTVYIVDRYHNHLWSISSDDGRQIITPLTHGLAAQCVNNGEVIVIENAYEDDRFDSDVDSRFGVDIRNVAWVPIKSEDCDRVLAVIEVINKQAEELLHFGEDDLRILEIFATIVGPQFDKSDFANCGNVDQTTEAGLAFENIQPMGSTTLQRIAEYSIKETEED